MPRRKTGWSLSSGAGISPAGGGALVAVPEAIAGGEVGGADGDLFSAGLLSAGLLSAGLLSAGLLSAGLLSAGLFSAGLFSEFGFSNDGRRNTGGASLSP